MEKELITQAEYARRRGITRMAINNAIKSGRITLENGMIDPIQADKDWEDHTDVAQQRNKDGGATMASDSSSSTENPKSEAPSSALSYARARAVRESALARLANLEVEKKTGKLVEVEEIEKMLYAMGRKIRNSIQAVPDRLAPILAAENDVVKIHTLMTKEYNEVLKGLARELRDPV